MAPIPNAITDKHIGILGINGSGKTYTAKGLAERLLDQKQRICVIDPTGVWYGLKSSATGKSAGYPVVIFGGPHADVQIAGSHGEAIAEAIGTSSTPAIIDTSLMRTGERTRFFADFAETLRVRNQGPLHLFIDEAHLFMPQGRVADPQSANMLHAANNLISLGRARGLRITIISQRPAKIHKDSLTQVHSLIAMRLIAPQDRAAVEAWIADQADIQKGKQIIASLPSLKTGEGWLWAPEIDILERIKFPKITTFDSGRSPDGETGAKIVLAPINLDTIQGKLASIKQEKVANDPLALKKRVAELEGQLRAKPTAMRGPDTKAVTDAVEEAYRKGHADRIEAYRMAFEAARATLASKVFDLISKTQLDRPKSQKPYKPHKPAPISASASHAVAPTIERQQQDYSDLSGPEQRVLRALQFWQDVGQPKPTRYQIAGVAGYSATASTLSVILASLLKKELIHYQDRGTVSLTQNCGESFAQDEAKAQLLSVIGGPEKNVLQALANGDELSKEEICNATGYSAAASTMSVILARLKGLDIVEYPNRGSVKVTDWAREILT
jgi:uncharacterized protein